ncbi:keratin, type II cytoskeletal 73-like [Liolophura sinensis]|uniref:keratin, type II cytoskeletal 73-like n=1 Tax=Liolophura sinensis TaxID=3198878 RepID=UPI003158D954
MERLVASMRAVDKSQIQVSNHMDALDYNVSDHDMLINELLKTQTRDSRILREKMEDLMAKSATQTKAFEELKVQTAQASNRFSALTESIAKVSQRNDQLREKIDALKDSSAEFKASWDSSDIDELKSTQQILMNQLHKLGNAEVVLASELKRFPNLVNQLTDDIRRTKNDQSEREAAFQRLKSETDALKLQIRNLQPQPKPGGHRGYQHDQSLEDELELLNLRRGRRDVSETAASNGLLDRKVVTTNSAASGDSATLSSTHNIHKRARHRRKNTAIKDWRLWHTQHRKRTRAVSGLRRGPTPDITDNSKQDTTPR